MEILWQLVTMVMASKSSILTQVGFPMINLKNVTLFDFSLLIQNLMEESFVVTLFSWPVLKENFYLIISEQIKQKKVIEYLIIHLTHVLIQLLTCVCLHHSGEDLDLWTPGCVCSMLEVGDSESREAWREGADVVRKWQTCEGVEEEGRRRGVAWSSGNDWTLCWTTRRHSGNGAKLHTLGHSFRFVKLTCYLFWEHDKIILYLNFVLLDEFVEGHRTSFGLLKTFLLSFERLLQCWNQLSSLSKMCMFESLRPFSCKNKCTAESWPEVLALVLWRVVWSHRIKTGIGLRGPRC